MMTNDKRSDAGAEQTRALLEGAVRSGVMTRESSDLLAADLGEVVVAGARGLAAEDILTADVTLVTLLVDASSSIAHRRLEDAVRAGQRALLEAFAGSREADAILVATWTFNVARRVVHSYVSLADAVRLDGRSYRASGGTALYDAWCDALAANVAYAESLRAGGTPCRSLVVALSDGEDTCSRRRAADCARVSRDVLASEEFVLAFVGVGDEVDFRKVAADMGVPAGCIAIERAATPAALRSAFQMVSRSAIRMSQGLVRPGAQAGFFGP